MKREKENENIYDISAIGDMPDIESLENEGREPEDSEVEENPEDSEKVEASEKDTDDGEPESAEGVGEIASNLMEAACRILRGELEAEELLALKDAVYARMEMDKLRMEMEEAVAEAYRQGEIAGRNATIEIEDDIPEELVPNLVGTPLHAGRSSEASIFDLARQARNK